MKHAILKKVANIKAISAQFARFPYFLIVGSIGYGISMGLTFLFTEKVHIWYLLSFMLAASISLTISFILNSMFTFRGYMRKSHSKRYAFYISFYALSAACTFAAVYLLTSVFGVHYSVSITVVTIVSSFVTYLVNQKFIFLYK